MVTKDNLSEVMQYHAPNDVQREQFERIRTAATALAETIIDNTPAGADQQAAIRKVREAMMTANAAVATRGAA